MTIQLPTEKIPARKKNPKLTLFYGLPKVGKALTMDSLILTNIGFKKMSSLSDDDMIIGSDGKPHNLLGIFPQGLKNCYRLLFIDGTSVECSEEHLWTVISKRNHSKHKKETKTTKQLKADYKDKQGRYIYAINYVLPVQFSEQEVPIHPYTLGLLIADGSLKNNKRLCLSKEKEELIPLVEGWSQLGLKRVGTSFDFNIKSSNIIKSIIQLKLNVNSYDKFIPFDYILNSVQNRMFLLQGLLDGDGYADQLKPGIEYSTSSKILGNQVVDLVRSLGGKATISNRTGIYRDEDAEEVYCKTNYRVWIQFFDNTVIPFNLSYKRNWYRKQTRFKEKAIVSIKLIGERECQCIAVNSPDGLFVTDGYNLTHNTTLMTQLENNLIIDIEDGSNYVEGLIIQAKDWSEVYQIGQEILAKDKPYKYITLDTATRLDGWAEDLGKILYLNSSVAKKAYKDNPDLLPSVTMLPGEKGSFGPGYQFVRLAYMKCFDYLLTLAEHIILIAHMRDKFLVDKEGTTVQANDLSFTGKIKQITCSRADAIGFIYRRIIGAENGIPITELRVSFNNSTELLSGSRCQHLKGQDFMFDWKRIFIDE